MLKEIYVVRKYQYDTKKEEGFSDDIETFESEYKAHKFCEELKKQDDADYYVWPCYTNLPHPNELV